MNGILIINKPPGLTSHDVVLKLRRKTGQPKIGHAGTLDPLATGVLILVLGHCTKLVNQLINQDKEYDVTLTLGIQTNTGDITGKIQQEKPVKDIDTPKIKNTLAEFKGEQLQTPPMISAKKYKGRPLYKYARQGKIIPRAPKKIHIYQIALGTINLPEINMHVHCSKGTYIRTLCEDIGNKLGPSGCASRIHRTKSGSFDIQQALELDKVLDMEQTDIQKQLMQANEVFSK